MKLHDPDAKKLFLSGKTILEELETSDLFENHSGSDCLNHYPTFDISELVIGPVLGHGGFGIVHEVQDIVLSSDNDRPNSRTNMNHALHPIVVHENDDATTESDSDNTNSKSQKKKRHNAMEGPEHFDRNVARSYLAANVRRRCTTPTLLTSNHGSNKLNKHKSMMPVSSTTKDNKNTTAPTTAARYAVKRLKSDLNELSRVRGAIDLAIEVKILSRLHHPNIGRFQKS